MVVIHFYRWMGGVPHHLSIFQKPRRAWIYHYQNSRHAAGWFYSLDIEYNRTFAKHPGRDPVGIDYCIGDCHLEHE